MEVDRDQIFNLWDTNGRRKDVLNALSLYLGIIKEMVDDGTFDEWASFPNSITQFIFYSKAIEQSPEVFKRHPKYDDFINELGVESYLSVNKKFFSETISNEEQLLETLDKDIEQRARHYTSNLVRFGFASNERKITQSGYSYLSSNIEKDSMEKMLSLNETNIILLRQLMKLRIFSKNCGGKRTYYSPFYVGLYLLLNNDTLGKDDFISIVQGINPYLDFEIIKEKLKYNNVQDLIQYIVDNSVEIGSVPIVFMLPGKITKKNFDEYIENRKTTSTVDCYYEFYESLLEFVENRSVENYERLKLSYISNKDKIKKAFCLGKTIFDFGTNGIFSLDEFNLHNENNVFLNSEHLNETFYKMYKKSKYIDQVAEYSDTTIRVLGATGLFKFKTMPELSNKTLMSILFNDIDLLELAFGSCFDNEYVDYESITFGSNISFMEILEPQKPSLENRMALLSKEYGSTDETIIKNCIETKTSDLFKKHIEENYPIERVINLLSLFSDRNNDLKIKQEINISATVPTIYEYIIGIAWYYISNKNFDLYHSFNLTLNADFEPEMHAGGGVGDIVIDYDDISIILEVTLMNKSAQKRGEWEPVLRHSLNNKAANLNKENYTFFVADDLDFNTINIWRAVASAPLKSTSGDEAEINGVVIMPFTNDNIINFMNNNIKSKRIIELVKESFSKVPKITDSNWHSDIINSL